MSPRFQDLLPVLADAGVRFIIIGGVAASAHGAARATYDLDVVYGRDPEDIKRLVAALRPYEPYCEALRLGSPSLGTSEPFRVGSTSR